MLMLVLLMSLVYPALRPIDDMPAMRKVPVVTVVQPTIYTGYAPHYAPGVMRHVAENRGMKPVSCMVSSPRYSLGTWLHVTSLKNDRTRLCRVTDISAPQDRARHLRNNVLVEFDFTSAQIMCDIEYVSQEPPRACPVAVYEIEAQ